LRCADEPLGADTMSASNLHSTLPKKGLQRSAELTKKLAERQTKKEESKNAAGQPILNPWSCVAIKNEKYAKQCVEVFLSGKGAVEISTEFRHFPSLEVVWFNNNRLTELRNLEVNFRIQEVYVENNRLVSLKGLKKLRFLRVLLARNNQLRNLDKQTELLRSFSFLTRLDLADNAVADEPDYRLRIIYHLPQVEDLDRSAVKPHDRIRANEVVPNLDKVVEKPEAALRKKSVFQQLSPMEYHCFKEAKELRTRYKEEEEAANQARYAACIDWSSLSKPKKNARSPDHLSSWEQAQVFRFLLQKYVHGKTAAEVVLGERQDVQALNAKLSGAAPDAGGKKDPKAKGGGGGGSDGKAERKADLNLLEQKRMTREEVQDVLQVLAQGQETYLGRVLTDPCAFEEGGELKRTRSVSMSKQDLRQRKEGSKAKRAFWDAWKEQPDATKPLLDVFKWAVTLEWSWEDDDAINQRLQFLERERQLARLTNREEDERCFSMLYNRMEGVKTRSRVPSCLLGAKHDDPHVDADWANALTQRQYQPAVRTVRTDVLPSLQMVSKEVVDPFSGRTSIGFDRKTATFRFA